MNRHGGAHVLYIYTHDICRAIEDVVGGGDKEDDDFAS